MTKISAISVFFPWTLLLEALILVASQGTWQEPGAGYQGGGLTPNHGQTYPAPASPQRPGYNPGQVPAQPPPGYYPGHVPAQGPGQGPGQYPPQGPGQSPGQNIPVAPTTPTRVKFLILGAGAAGLQAAETLVSKGETDFLILEAAETYGGRIRDIQFAGVRVETGADTPRPKSEALDSAVRGLGARMRMHKPNWQSLTMISEEGHTNLTRVAMRTHAWPRGFNGNMHSATYETAGWDAEGNIQVAHAIREGLNQAEELWESHDTDMPVRAAFQSIGWFPGTPLERTMEWLHFDYQLGDVPRAASLMSHAFDAPELIVQRGPNANPPRQVTDQRGFKSFFDATLMFMQDSTMRNKILYNKEVTDVDYGSPMHVRVTCRDGSIYEASWAISTFSVGVLQNQVVQFKPEFPGWKTRELNRFVMGAHTKVFMEFPYTFWGNKEFVLRVANKRGHYPLFVDLGTRIPELRRNERHVLMAEISGDEARRIDAQPLVQTRRELMGVLRQMYRFNIPDPLAIYVSGWNSNRRTMGSQSLWSPALNTKCFSRVQSRLGRLLFAGEHTSLRFSGHIQGAIESGKREADKAYLCSTGGTCPQWSEGLQCACSGTTPPQLKGASSPGSKPLRWGLGFAVFLATVVNRLMNF